jgi:Lon protease-like protein
MDMFELPLFPLNTVLFPGMPLPLHIFEDRYKEMIQLCLKEQSPFGVIFIRRGESAGGPLATPHSVGCTARIVQVESLANERMLIMTVGQERFRIVSLKHDRPYLVGLVESAPLPDITADALDWVDRLYPLMVEYLDVLSNIGEVTYNASQLPTDPRKLVYLAAGFIQLPQEQKQPLLETDNASRLLKELYSIYRREVATLRTMPKEDQGVFSMS